MYETCGQSAEAEKRSRSGALFTVGYSWAEINRSIIGNRH
jgi:hypothetical protein